MQQIVLNQGYIGLNLTFKEVLNYGQLANLDLYPYYWQNNKPVNAEDSPKVNTVYFLTQPLSEGLSWEENYFDHDDIPRDDVNLLEIAKESNHLNIVNVPDGVEWVIANDDRFREWVAEKHRTWC